MFLNDAWLEDNRASKVLKEENYGPAPSWLKRRTNHVVLWGTGDGAPHVLPESLIRNKVLDAIRQTGS